VGKGAGGLGKSGLAYLLLVLALATTGRAQTPRPHTPPIAYYGIYLAQGKLGSATIVRDLHATRAGHAAIRTEMAMHMILNVGGQSNKIDTTDITYTDAKSGAPLASENRTVASGRVTDVKATYTANSLTYDSDVQGAKKTATITLAPGQHFLVDPTDGADIKPAVGMKVAGKVFVPDLFQLVDAEVEVVGKETVTVSGTAVSAFKIIDRNSIESSTLFASEDGDLLRIDNAVAGIPMQIRKEPQAVAEAAPGANATPDIVALTTIRPTGASMGDARTASSITYRLSGVTRALAPTDSVQTVTYAGAIPGAGGASVAGAADVTVHARALPRRADAVLYARPADAPANLRPFLEASPYVAAGDPAFRALAQKVLAGETNCARAARKIAAYVHRTVKPDPSIAALRTATDVLSDPRGVCRDYTALFAAIARSAGLPTKECVGLGYADGAFLGHAWPEVWVGRDEDGRDEWFALEPTWGVPFADATHIKLAEGEITDFFAVAADLGKYKIQVLKVE
jgi:hypothetical protein